MLVRDLPRTLDALAAGHTNEYRAGLVAHAAACLGAADRAALDADLGPRLTGKGNQAVQGEADRIAAGLDPAAVVERHRRAVADRRVTSRPAPDAMTYLTALLPVADGVAAWAALDRHATLTRAGGDRRTRGQIMADELTQRVLYGMPTPLPHTLTPTPTGASNSAVPAVPADPAGPDRTEPATDPSPAGTASGSGCPVMSGALTGDPVTGEAAPTEAGSGDVHRPVLLPGHPLPDCRTPSPTAPGPIAVPDHTGPPPDDHTDPPRDAHPDDQPSRPASSPPSVPPVRQIDLMLVMTDRTLLDDADTPAIIPGHGPIPAALARGLLADADPATRVFLRRLYTDPTGDHLLTADTRGRLFPHAIRQFVLARDHRCRTPYCDAPIRHIDHTVPHAAGGPTTLTNTGGLCARCNLAKASRNGPDVRPGPPPRPPRSAPWGADGDPPLRGAARRPTDDRG